MIGSIGCGTVFAVVMLYPAAWLVGPRPPDTWGVVKTGFVSAFAGIVGAVLASLWAADLGGGLLMMLGGAVLIRFLATTAAATAWITDLARAVMVTALSVVFEIVVTVVLGILLGAVLIASVQS